MCLWIIDVLAGCFVPRSLFIRPGRQTSRIDRTRKEGMFFWQARISFNQRIVWASTIWSGNFVFADCKWCGVLLFFLSHIRWFYSAAAGVEFPGGCVHNWPIISPWMHGEANVWIDTRNDPIWALPWLSRSFHCNHPPLRWNSPWMVTICGGRRHNVKKR